MHFKENFQFPLNYTSIGHVVTRDLKITVHPIFESISGFAWFKLKKNRNIPVIHVKEYKQMKQLNINGVVRTHKRLLQCASIG